MPIFIGVGEFGVSNRIGEVLKTMALGSCIAVIALAPQKGVAGLLHIQLPESSINPGLAADKPGMFADTGIPLLLQLLQQAGCSQKELTIKLAGAAQILDPNNTFSIGKRNYLATKKFLWAKRLFPKPEDVGENFSRTVVLTVGQEKVLLSCPSRGEWVF